MQAEDAQYLSEEEEEEAVKEEEEVSLTAWRTHPKDEVGIASILDAKSENFFGKIDLMEVLEKSVIQVDEWEREKRRIDRWIDRSIDR